MNKVVFISFSSEDLQVAVQLLYYLEQNGIPCWFAKRDVPPGVPYGLAITRALDVTPVYLLVLSRQSMASQHVSSELDIAFNRHLLIIPYKIDPYPIGGDFLYYLNRAQWIDATQNPYACFQYACVSIKQFLSARYGMRFEIPAEGNIETESSKQCETDDEGLSTAAKVGIAAGAAALATATLAAILGGDDETETSV